MIKKPSTFPSLIKNISVSFILKQIMSVHVTLIKVSNNVFKPHTKLNYSNLLHGEGPTAVRLWKRSSQTDTFAKLPNRVRSHANRKQNTEMLGVEDTAYSQVCSLNGVLIWRYMYRNDRYLRRIQNTPDTIKESKILLVLKGIKHFPGNNRR